MCIIIKIKNKKKSKKGKKEIAYEIYGRSTKLENKANNIQTFASNKFLH